MATRSRRATRLRQRQRARLRLIVLRLGGTLGWGPRDVIGFAEALTGRSWQRCGRSDLEDVRDEYLVLFWTIRRKDARRSGYRPISLVLAGEGYRHAVQG